MPEFKMFDKVLVRDSDKDDWVATFFSHYDAEGQIIAINDAPWEYCIPALGNEDLVGTNRSKWEPKPNELVAVSDNSVEWVMRIFKETIHENGTNRFITKIGKANSPTTISWRYCEPVKKHFDFILPE